MSEIAEKPDLRSLNCPLPVLKPRQAIKRIEAG